MNVAELLVPRLWALAGELRATLQRLAGGRDDEAVHDMRVAIRRMRSLLKPARRVFGAFHADAVQARLKALADATGDLRDEEVLAETLSALELGAASRRSLRAFLRVRGARLSALRRALVELVEVGEAERTVRLLEALVTLPVRPKRGRDAIEFARRTVERARRKVDARQREGALDVLDTAAMHELRILYKRLRYAVEGFGDVLPPELAALAARAAKFQKRLGELHDVDVALAIVRESADLADGTRAEVLAALEGARERCVGRYLDEVARARVGGAAAQGGAAAVDEAKSAGAAAAPAPSVDAKGPPKSPPPPRRPRINKTSKSPAATSAGSVRPRSKPSAKAASHQGDGPVTKPAGAGRPASSRGRGRRGAT